MNESCFLRISAQHYFNTISTLTQLNAQGRARPEIAALYNWRYKDLGNLPLVQSKPQYLTANAGFAYDYQMVDVPDFEVTD